MFTHRKAQDRGRSEYSWLDSRHSFSFADYYDPEQMGFSVLRVINDDRVAPAGGFATHGHQDMEIISYVVEGEMEHRDSMGNTARIRAGEVQVMSAGTGIRHSEYNASDTQPLRFLQIWILPEKTGLTPSYHQPAQRAVDAGKGLQLQVSADADGGAARIHQQVAVYVGHLDAGTTASHVFERGRKGWLQMVNGEVQVAGLTLAEGDGLGMEDEGEIIIDARQPAELVLFDLP